MSACCNVKRYAKAQEAHMRRAIDENKWYLSERAGRDVGPQVAETDFMRCHLGRVAAEFRVEFCTDQCPQRDRCTLSDRIHELNRNWSERQLFG